MGRRQLAEPPGRRGSWARTAYDATLSGDGTFSTPEWETAFGYITQLREHSCVNESANAIADNEGAELFFQGAAAMHPIGSWLVSWAIDEAPDLEFDFVNLPAMPEGSAGDQGSVIGVETGYMVNANSPNIPLAVDFLALMNSAENVKRFVDRGGDHPHRARPSRDAGRRGSIAAPRSSC